MGRAYGIIVSVVLLSATGCITPPTPGSAADPVPSTPPGVVGVEGAYAEDSGGAAQAPKSYAVPLSLQPVMARQIPLKGESLRLAAGVHEDARSIPVALTETTYHADYLVVGEHGTQAKSRQLLLYELNSTDPAVPYSWALWATRPLFYFSLLTDAEGISYLSWVYVNVVLFDNVSLPRDRSVAFAKCLVGNAAGGAVVVPVGSLVAPDLLFGHNAIAAEIDVRSISVPTEGQWRIELTGPDPAKVFILVFKGSEWSLE